MAKSKKPAATSSAKKKPATKKRATKEEKQTVGDQEVQIDRRWKSRRAKGATEEDTPDSVEEEIVAEDVESTDEIADPPQRRKKQRRRQIDPTTCERDYNDEEIRFMRAMDDYKRDSGRMFPTCSEILEVIRALGYAKLTEEEQQLIESIQEVEDDLAEATAPEATEGEPEDAFEICEDDSSLL